MSGNTSATGGFLVPIDPQPDEDDILTNAMQATIVGVTGLDPTLVRPRWQPKMPNQPPVEVTWAAVGIVSTDPLGMPYIKEYDPGDGTIIQQLQRHESLSWIVSFYGPNDGHYAGVFRDGMYIPQNLEYLDTFGIKLRAVSGNSNVPELINNQWVPRTDVRFVLVRQLNREYKVLTLLSASGFVQFQSKTLGSAPWNAHPFV